MVPFQQAQIKNGDKELERRMILYQKVIRLQPYNIKARTDLAKIKLKLGDIEGAVAVYSKALTLSEPSAELYQGWGDLLEKSNKIVEAIAAYKEAIKLKANKSSFYLKLARLYFKRIPEKCSELISTTKPQLEIQEDLIHQVWKTLNQSSLEQLGRQKFIACNFYLNNLDLKRLEQYFTQRSQYQIFDLAALSDPEKEVIENSGLSLSALRLNTAEHIKLDEIFTQNLSVEVLANPLNIPQQVSEANRRNRFQLSAVQEGCIYAVCPTTGKVIASTRSLVLPQHDLNYIFYRFIGEEVFYLVTGLCWFGFPKLYLYFPEKEIVILLFTDSSLQKQHFLELVKTSLTQFKAYMVTHASKVCSYLLNPCSPQTILLVGIQHFAHHLWNELSGIHRLYESRLLDRLDKLMVAAEPLGSIHDIFPEISPEKIQSIHKIEQVSEFLDHHYFAIRLGHTFIREDLVNRIYNASLKYCHSAFLVEVEEAKQKCFPLFWVTVRLDHRTWLSQKEGIVNIIKSLLQNYPRLGVVIDGFSMPRGFLGEGGLFKWGQAMVDRETAFVQEIRSLLPSSVPVYDTVGCIIYESVIWAHAIDFYLAHHGSVQHKVGWLANKPGVVHTNRQTLKQPVSHRAGAWERENGVIPVWISEDALADIETTDLESDQTSIKNDIRNNLENYDCDWKALYSDLLKIASCVSRN